MRLRLPPQVLDDLPPRRLGRAMKLLRAKRDNPAATPQDSSSFEAAKDLELCGLADIQMIPHELSGDEWFIVTLRGRR